MLTTQKLLLNEREIFMNHLVNLTAALSSSELRWLREAVNDNYNDLDRHLSPPPDDARRRQRPSLDQRLQSYMLATNRMQAPRPLDDSLSASLPFLLRASAASSSLNIKRMIERLEEALRSYESVIAVSAGEGINMTTKDFEYKWTYVQCIFFTSTIITTVGKQIAMITTMKYYQKNA